MNTSSKGTAAELRVASYLQARGWLVGSRRHIGGAGDLVAIRAEGERRLLEVKASSVKRGPFADFKPHDRKALLQTAKEFRAEPLLAWSPTPSRVQMIPPKDWP